VVERATVLPALHLRPRRLGVTLGDVAGIGPEVALKALQFLQGPADIQYVVVGEPVVVKQTCQSLGVPSPRVISSLQESFPDSVAIWCPPGPALDRPFSPGGLETSMAAVEWLRAAGVACRDGLLDGVVTAPVNKEAILRAGIPFVGQTEFLTELAGNGPTGMMLLGPDDRARWLRVLLATTHLPLKHVASSLTTNGVRTTIELAALACRELGLPTSRIAVCGLNPHAGEGGKMGSEEIAIIRPAVAHAEAAGIDVTGPFPADTLFHRAYRGDFDVVIAMYHDQGLVPLKMVAFDSGVNWTVGLPFVRTSPDHGTAYDIAGKGVANPSSMMAALRLARQLLGGNAGS
jgi:4-hydroxythreonine-4-phosphate dehydrogenase